MQCQVETAEQRHRKEINEKVAQVDELQVRINQLESLVVQLKESEKRTAQERDFWKDRAVQHEQLVKQMKSRRPSLTGWGDNHTAFFQAKLPNSRQDSPTRDSISTYTPMATTPQAYDTPKTIDIGCGNCKIGGPCACMEEMANLSTATTFMAAVPLNQAPVRTSASPMKGIQTQMIPIDAATAALFAEREIDFTAQFTTRKTQLDSRSSIAFLTQASESDSKCGFCTDDANCFCRDMTLHEPRSDDIAPPSGDWTRATSSKAKTTADGRATTGPGTCSDCMKDPKQRAWCQRVAQLKDSESSYLGSTSRASSISGTLDPIEPRTDYAPVPETNAPHYSIGCSDAYKLFDGRVPTDPDSMDWSTLKPISLAAQTNTIPGLHSVSSRKYSALELDTAGVIATLQQTMGPLHPRKEDGPLADLVVRAAAENQRTEVIPT